MDHKAEQLRTQAVQLCASAMGASQVHVYGPLGHEWGGVVLDTRDQFTVHTHWTDDEGRRWRYMTHVNVRVEKVEV